MDWKQIGSQIANYAPMLGGILGGPPGAALGAGVKMISKALGLNPDTATPAQVEQKLKNDPQALLKIKQMELAHERELTQLYLKDVSDARAREVAVVQATGKKDTNLYILAYLYVAGFFGSTGMMIYLILANKFPNDVPEYVVFLLGNLFGALTAGVTAVVQYFFGSSKSSSDKTALIAGQSPR